MPSCRNSTSVSWKLRVVSIYFNLGVVKFLKDKENRNCKRTLKRREDGENVVNLRIMENRN